MTAFSRRAGPIPPEPILEAINDLLALAKEGFPIVMPRDTPRYRLCAAGLLARTLTIAEAIVHLNALERTADLTVLGRVLYEHVVMLAWIAAPRDDSRIDMWQQHDNEERLKFDAEISEMRGQGAFSDHDRRWMQAARDELGKSRVPPLSVRAEQADKEWSHRVPFRGLASIRGGYTTTYRGGSASTHPTLIGLNHIWERAGDHTVITVEPTADTGPVLGPIVSYLGIALLVASDTLGRPTLHRLNEVMQSFAVAAWTPRNNT